MNDANSLGIPTYEADVVCGMWCQGGSVKFYPTDHPHYTDIADVWVKGSDALNLVDTLRAELAELRKDAERYRWLRDRNGLSLLQRVHHWTDPSGNEFTTGYCLDAEGIRLAYGITLDAAVDSAAQALATVMETPSGRNIVNRDAINNGHRTAETGWSK